MIVATLLVLMMTTPALAFFYGGMSRSKSVLNMMMMSFVSMGVVGIVYVLWGWSESFGDGFSGDGKLFANPFTLFGLKDVTPDNYIFVMFQLTFAAITAALISGAVADRVKLSSWIVFLPFWVTLSYFPLAHMVFGGGYIGSTIGAQDYAGGTAVHINAGVAGLVLALIVGKRVNWPRDPMRPHNLTLTMLGAGLLWVGWYGFNVGSIVLGNVFGESASGDKANIAQFVSETGRTFLNTTIATMAAMLGWLLVERILHKKASALGAASGIVAGLVAITPACGAVDLVGAICIGAIAGGVCAWAVSLKFKLGFDDSFDVVGVHLVGGIIGTVLIGLFSVKAGAGGVDGLFHGGGLASLGDQAAGAGIAILWSGVATAIIGFAIKFTIGWRITDEEEVDGIDFAEHGESAYDLDGRSAGIPGTGTTTAATISKEGALA
ncbi:ammonium transporter [Jatrophihabitans endophyticus]